MNIKNLILVLATVLIVASYAKSQTSEPPVKTIIAPTYPAAGRAINAGGKVIVNVEINTLGEVITAKAVTGHPLLRQASENAAKRWRFFPIAMAKTLQLTFIFQITSKDETEDELASIFTYPYQVEVKSRPADPIVYSDLPSRVIPVKRNKKQYQ